MPTNTLLDRGRAVRAAFYDAHAELFTALSAQGQSPSILFIGCSDSRVIPEELTGASPGDLFVLRNIANLVPPFGTAGDAVGAVIEFAVLQLSVEHLIVCGHTDCGGIRALDDHIDQTNEPHMARWLGFARSAQTQVDARGVAPEERHRSIVEQNVLNQFANLQTYDAVRNAMETQKLELHAWIYDLSCGRISSWDAEAGRFVDENEI